MDTSNKAGLWPEPAVLRPGRLFWATAQERPGRGGKPNHQDAGAGLLTGDAGRANGRVSGAAGTHALPPFAPGDRLQEERQAGGQEGNAGKLATSWC